MKYCEVFDDCKTQTGASHIARTSAIHPVETFEESLEMLCRNAFAIILDDDLVSLACLILDSDGATLTAKLDSILNQVCEHSIQTARVSKDNCAGRDLVHDFHSMDRSLTRQRRVNLAN